MLCPSVPPTWLPKSYDVITGVCPALKCLRGSCVLPMLAEGPARRSSLRGFLCQLCVRVDRARTDKRPTVCPNLRGGPSRETFAGEAANLTTAFGPKLAKHIRMILYCPRPATCLAMGRCRHSASSRNAVFHFKHAPERTGCGGDEAHSNLFGRSPSTTAATRQARCIQSRALGCERGQFLGNSPGIILSIMFACRPANFDTSWPTSANVLAGSANC